LAVYNRQYWFRMFDVLQRTFPLTARLLGHWLFNDYASRFLLAHPPRGWDIDRACDGFVAFFSEAVGDAASAERDAWIESARLDDAWQRVFGAPEIEPYRPSAADAEHLLEGRLTPSPAVALVEEHWPLLELRAQVLRDGNGEKAVPLPPRLPRSRWWALVRTDQGIGQLPLDAREAELFGLLSQLAVGDALAELERICEPEERVDLPRKTQMWLARSVTLDFWTGLSRR
jgi:hypothetical protein